jgi:hypothetical protein
MTSVKVLRQIYGESMLIGGLMTPFAGITQ